EIQLARPEVTLRGGARCPTGAPAARPPEQAATRERSTPANAQPEPTPGRQAAPVPGQPAMDLRLSRAGDRQGLPLVERGWREAAQVRAQPRDDQQTSGRQGPPDRGGRGD